MSFWISIRFHYSFLSLHLPDPSNLFSGCEQKSMCLLPLHYSHFWGQNQQMTTIPLGWFQRVCVGPVMTLPGLNLAAKWALTILEARRYFGLTRQMFAFTKSSMPIWWTGVAQTSADWPISSSIYLFILQWEDFSLYLPPYLYCWASTSLTLRVTEKSLLWMTPYLADGPMTKSARVVIPTSSSTISLFCGQTMHLYLRWTVS